MATIEHRVTTLERCRQRQMDREVAAVAAAFNGRYPDEVPHMIAALQKSIAYGNAALLTREEESAGAHFNEILTCVRYGLPSVPLTRSNAHPDGSEPDEVTDDDD